MQKYMRNNIIIIGLIVILFLITFKKCGVKVTETKTEYIQGKTDTVYTTKTVYAPGIPVTSVRVVRDTIIDSILIVQANEYVTEYRDSLIDMEIKQIVQGTLLNTDVKYTANIPSYHRVDTLKITNTIQPKGIYIGTQFGYRNITPKASYLWDRYQVEAGFNVYNRTPIVGLSVKF